jgi:RimJ/RimL family protein N-acetyltransferase
MQEILAMPSPLTPEIRTSRLALIAIRPDSLHAEQSAKGDFHRLAQRINCAIHPEWPPVHWEPHVLTFILEQFANNPTQLGWHRYVALIEDNDSRTRVGCLGAFAKDDSPTTCEIGYGILPSFEGKGYATEGARALIDHLHTSTGITSIIASSRFPPATLFSVQTSSCRAPERDTSEIRGESACP